MRRVFLFCLICVSLLGQTKNDPWAPSSSYNPSIPTIESVLGHKAGEKFTAYSNLEKYYQAVAAVSDRMKMESYGATYEGRKQYLITISSPKNLARLDDIRAAMSRLNDPRKTAPAEAQSLSEANPIVVWLGYGVHGNEANSAEAAMQVVYELTASEDPRVKEWLDNCVVLIDPLTNPDGHERYVQFYNSVAGEHPVADRFAVEQQERWPSGRSNHYYFDLNRDWAWQSQQETRNRLKVYLAWHPQVAADLHEMGSRSTYFFAPPAEPFYDPLRTQLSKWYEIFGRGNAAAFDRYGFRYYTKEGYDLFAPTYGDSWPALNGAVGMTYEMAGGGSGLAISLDDDERTLTLRDRAVRHFTSSLATIDTATKNRVARLRSFYDFHQAAIDAGMQNRSRQIFLVPGKDQSRVAHLVAMLLGQGIEVGRSDSAISIDDAGGYWGEQLNGKKQVPAGTYVVDLAQPAGFLAQAILEREAHLVTSDTYDITGWTLPLTMDVEAYAGHAAVHTVPVTEAPKADGRVEGAQEASAYLIDWSQGNAAVLLNHLLQEDFKAYVSLQAFKQGGKQFSAGTVIVPAETNPATLNNRIRQLAQKDGCTVEAVSSQMNESGVDLGSPQVRFLRKPRIAVVMDTPINSNDYGAIWHLFEQRLDIPFTPVRAESFGGLDLHQYNVIVLAGEANLDSKRVEEWVKSGGVFIGIRGGAIYATKKKSGLTSVTYKFLQRGPEEARIEQERTAKKDDNAKPDDAPPPPSAEEKKKEADAKLARKLMKYADREKEERDSQVPGTIMRTVVDNTHPLAFGLGDKLAVLDRTSPILELTDKGENPVYFPKDGIKLSGYISAENEKKLSQTAYEVRERNGRGYVVLFADSPVFRGFWDGTSRLLVNAVFFGNVSDPRLP